MASHAVVNCGYLNNMANLTRAVITIQPQSQNEPSGPLLRLVAQCPGVCDAIYGDGNPDISGVGVVFSFTLQGLYFALFGPLLVVIALATHAAGRDRGGLRAQLARFRRLFDAVHATGVFLAFSSLVATLVRLQQTPPLYEISFLTCLAEYFALLSSMGLFLYHGFAICLDGSSVARLIRTQHLSVLGDLLNFALAQYVLASIPRPSLKSIFSVFKLVANTCVKDLDFPDPGSPFNLAGWLSSVGLCISILPMSFTVAIIRFRPGLSSKIAPDVMAALPYSARLVCCAMLMLFNAFNVYCIHRRVELLWTIRAKMAALDLPTNQDNEWGFGQTTAVLLWLPTTVWIILELFRWLPWCMLVVVLRIPNKPSLAGTRSSPVSVLSAVMLWLETVSPATEDLDSAVQMPSCPHCGFKDDGLSVEESTARSVNVDSALAAHSRLAATDHSKHPYPRPAPGSI